LPAILCALVGAVSYFRGTFWRLATVLAVCLAGATAAKLRVDGLTGPAIERPLVTELTGRVVGRENRAERRPRVVLDRVQANGLAPDAVPRRIRLSLGPEAGLPPLGARVALKARLMPVSGPAIPGGYDPRRAAFFDGIGGSGFALGGWRIAEPPARFSLDLFVSRVRAAIVERIMTASPGEGGAVAAALLVGERSALSTETNEDLRVSGLAHILSISGLHMMLIAGTTFLLVRAGLALFPSLALARPIRKWAAVAALIVVTIYLALSGGGVATVRSYVMAVVMFAAILMDRPAISMRNLAVAAFIVLAAEPESVVEPGFQMSFAAVAALVAGWEAWQARSRRRLVDEDVLPGSWLIRWARSALAGVALTTLIAGLATAPFAAYHFERIATFSLLGNLLAAPLVSAIIMPFGLLTLVAMPLGLEPLPLAVMVWGIDALLWIAATVANLPGADLQAPPMSGGSLLVVAAGMLWLCLWRLRWRLFAVPVIGLGLLLAPALVHAPDLLVAADRMVVAARDGGGKLRVSGGRTGSYVVEQFFDEERGPPPDGGALRQGVACDELGCLLTASGGRRVAHVHDPAAFPEDCSRAEIIVTPIAGPASCGASLVIDRRRLDRFGAHAVRLSKVGNDLSLISSPREPHFRGPGRRAISPAQTAPRASVFPQQPGKPSLDPHPVRPEDPGFIGRVGGLECERGPFPAQPLQRSLFIVDERHHDVAGIGRLLLFDDDRIAVEDPGLDHGVPAHLQGEMLAAGQHFRRNRDGVGVVLDGGDRNAGRDAPHHRHGDRVAGRLLIARSFFLPMRDLRRLAQAPFDHVGAEAALPQAGEARTGSLWQAHNLEGARPIGQPPNEAALFQRRYEAMDSGFGS
jgi:competence protein ComEC